MPTAGSMFAGYGGIDLALAMIDPTARTAWVADIEPGPRRVLAHRYPDAITRWETVLGRPAPAATEPTTTTSGGGERLSPRLVEWMMGLPTGWVTAVPGVTRTQALRMLGNGVVPQQAAHALRTLAQWAQHDAPPPDETDESGTPSMLDLLTTP